jgi:vitamin B12 transporter
VLGTRFDDNEQFGGNWTGNVTWGYTFGKPLRVTAGWGTAFKAASFNDLYFPPEFTVDVNGDPVLVFEGNPNLDPESSESWEIGASGEAVGVHWSLSGYYTDLENLIATVFDPATCPRGALFCPRNIDEARILGLEAGASTTLFGVDIAANLSLLDPEDRSDGPNRGNVLPRRAQQMFQFDLDRRFGPLRVGATVYGEGRRFNDVANTERLAGYVLLDLRAGVELHKNWMLEGRINNVLDKDYETVALFNQDDTNLFITLRYVPDAGQP